MAEVTSSSSSPCRLRFEVIVSDDLLYCIFSYFSVENIIQTGTVNKRWQGVLSRDEGALWIFFLDELWKDKSVNVPAVKTILDRIKALPLGLVKRALHRVDISRCIEKPDFQRMLIVRLLFGERGPKKRCFCFFPEWALRMGQYKASYFEAKKDMRRQDITVSELCRIKWVFHFKHHQPMDQDTDGPSPTWESTFSEDFTMNSAMHSERLTWQFIDNGPHTRRMIQVEQYPPLTCTRLPSGGWRLDNHYVWLEQTVSIDADNVPLLDLTA